VKIVIKKVKVETNSFDNTSVMVVAEVTTLDEALQAYEDFLRGCGFHFDGSLEVIGPDDCGCGVLKDDVETIKKLKNHPYK
jgi:hypothetical protein